MKTTVLDNPKAGRIELFADGKLAGFISYERTGATVTLTHIETDLSLAGKGLGLVLVRGALDVASAGGLSVLPVCPFVRDYIERHPAYLDLVPPDKRERFRLSAAT